MKIIKTILLINILSVILWGTYTMGYNLLMEKFFPGELQFGDPFRFGSFLSYELIVIGQIVTILLVVLCFIIFSNVTNLFVRKKCCNLTYLFCS